MNTIPILPHPLHEWACFATFDGSGDAFRLKELLEKHGFETMVQDERKLQRFWFFALPKASAHVLVLKNSLEAANRVLEADPQANGLRARMVRCPSCQSSQVQYPSLTRKFLLPTIAADLLRFLHLFKHKYYCKDCHYTWLDPETSGNAGGAVKSVKSI